MKKIFRRKKKSPLKKAWKEMKKALPTKKRKKRSSQLLDRLGLRKRKDSQKEKEPKTLRRLFTVKREPSEDRTPAEKDHEGALGKFRERIKSKVRRHPPRAEDAAAPVSLEETPEPDGAGSGPRPEEKDPKRKLKQILKSIRPSRSRTNEGVREKEA